MVEFSETHWLNQLKAGDLEAATPLWTAYFCRLMGLARQKLNGSPQRVADAEDVALSAFHSFCKGVLDERFQKLNDRNDLWQVLAMITTRKALRQMERERALKRGGGAVRGESVFLKADGSFVAAGMSQVVANGPSPEFQVAAEEQFNRLLGMLDEPLLREVALLRLEGHSNEQIAEEIGRNVRTVERKLNLIRSLWSQETGNDQL
ncbi:MAG: hypothetical protein KDA86_20685 [Planctomycetaceae bacterium]|nr:hypothetical protein [Planctomycetaceae bacterium]